VNYTINKLVFGLKKNITPVPMHNMEHNQLKLSPEKREELVRFHRTLRDRRIADRIKAILLLDAGYSHEQVSSILLIDSDTIRKCEKKFLQGDIDALIAYSYTAYEGKLSQPQREELREHLRTNVYQCALEVREYIRKNYDAQYTQDAVIKLLHRLGFSYKKMKGVPAKADPNKQEEFVKQYESMRKLLKKDEKIYFLDASHPIYNSVPTYAWIEKGKEKELPQVSGRDKMNINGLYSPIDGETIIRMPESVTGSTTLDLIKTAKSKHRELSRIIVIHDNAKAYHSRYLKERLPEGVELMALPPYSPNLNLIERLWKYFRKEIMNNKYHENFSAFRKESSKFFRCLHYRKHELMALMTENFHVVGS